MNVGKSLLKKAGFGSIHLEFKRCGKPTCRCCRGLLHGPYAYHHRCEDGRQRKSYVAMSALNETLETIERQKARKPKIVEILSLLKEPRHD